MTSVNFSGVKPTFSGVNRQAQPIFIEGENFLMKGDRIYFNKLGNFAVDKSCQRYTTTTQDCGSSVMLRRIKYTPFNEYVVVRESTTHSFGETQNG